MSLFQLYQQVGNDQRSRYDGNQDKIYPGLIKDLVGNDQRSRYDGNLGQVRALLPYQVQSGTTREVSTMGTSVISSPIYRLKSVGNDQRSQYDGNSFLI